MSTLSSPLKQRALQKLLLRRFGMALGTYGLALLLLWLTLLGDFYHGALSVAVAATLGAVLSQMAFLWLFLSGRNQRFADASLTEPQVLVALVWNTFFLAHVDSVRGTLMVLYVLILLFGVFQLPPRVFARCAGLAFIAFAGLNLWEAFQQRLQLPGQAVLQLLVLFIVLVWLTLFAGYVQALRQRMRQRRYALQAHQDTLRGMMRQLEDMVATDELTGLFNRRHFLRMAGRALDEMTPGRCHGLALIDLDHFKRINDVHGHAAGDRVLQTFAAVARACLREGDVLARYGGEEFVLLLPGATADHLMSCCERLRLAYAGAEPMGVDVPVLSLSAGMTLLTASDDLDEALQRADQALYRAKRSGRNRCEAAWEESDA
ncbi:diguanylate cyclase domain-containing protein [Pseudomonas knackmussii]|uniref:GGDEF domain-containing protein n=1 Tax=Pseudomonas knackmussii TaxID=65741 RepID=UPI003BBAED1A